MEEMGRKMIAWCRGLPLAVLVLRGVLVTKGSLREWERFYESKNRGGELYELFKGEVRDELLFSYVELPYPLKTCFLYLANFDEDEEINVDDLYMLWDAEGMLLSKDREVGETNLDVAERYLGELVGRSMVESKLEEVHPTVRRRFTSCRLHDMMRELCLSIVKKENFLKVHDYRGHRDKLPVVLNSSCLNDNKMPPMQAWYFSEDQDFKVHDKEKVNQHVRSLRLIKGNAIGPSNLKKFVPLRVLTISKTDVGKGEFINELIHLRYLKLSLHWNGKLPSSVDNLAYLQNLDLQDLSFDTIIMPNGFLRKLKRLRHLFLPNSFWFEETPNFSRSRIYGPTELETLVNFDNRICEMNDVIQLTKLRRLECRIHISSEDDGKEFKEFMDKVNLGPSGNLLYQLDLKNPKIDVYSEVLRGQLPEYWEGNLNILKIGSLRGKLLPEFSNYNLLIDLWLEGFEIEEDPMPTLEKLPNLKSLLLKWGKLKGKEMVCSAMGFPKLIIMTLRWVKNWEKWRVEEGAMPNLQRLYIWKCKELEKLPSGLKFVTSLQVLDISDMREEFTRRLIDCEEEQGQDFHIIRHIPHVDIRA